MSSKVILAALSVVALQALCVQATSIGVADSNSLGLNLADVDLTINTTLPTPPSFDFGAGNPIVQALRNIIDGIVAQITATYQACVKVIEEASDTLEKFPNTWADVLEAQLSALETIAEGTSNATFAACQAQQPSIRNVSSVFIAELRPCILNPFFSVNHSIWTLESLQDEAVDLVGDIRKAYQDCQPSGLWAFSCFAAKSPPFFAQASGLALNAARNVVDINREVLNLPGKITACSNADLNKLTDETTAIVDAIEKCVQDSANVN